MSSLSGMNMIGTIQTRRSHGKKLAFFLLKVEEFNNERDDYKLNPLCSVGSTVQLVLDLTRWQDTRERFTCFVAMLRPKTRVSVFAFLDLNQAKTASNNPTSLSSSSSPSSEESKQHNLVSIFASMVHIQQLDPNADSVIRALEFRVLKLLSRPELCTALQSSLETVTQLEQLHHRKNSTMDHSSATPSLSSSPPLVATADLPNQPTHVPQQVMKANLKQNKYNFRQAVLRQVQILSGASPQNLGKKPAKLRKHRISKQDLGLLARLEESCGAVLARAPVQLAPPADLTHRQTRLLEQFKPRVDETKALENLLMEEKEQHGGREGLKESSPASQLGLGSLLHSHLENPQAMSARTASALSFFPSLLLSLYIYIYI